MSIEQTFFMHVGSIVCILFAVYISAVILFSLYDTICKKIGYYKAEREWELRREEYYKDIYGADYEKVKKEE